MTASPTATRIIKRALCRPGNAIRVGRLLCGASKFSEVVADGNDNRG